MRPLQRLPELGHHAGRLAAQLGAVDQQRAARQRGHAATLARAG